MTDTPTPTEARERIRRLLEASKHRAPSWYLTAWDSKGWAIVDRTTLFTAFTAMNDVCEAAKAYADLMEDLSADGTKDAEAWLTLLAALERMKETKDADSHST